MISIRRWMRVPGAARLTMYERASGLLRVSAGASASRIPMPPEAATPWWGLAATALDGEAIVAARADRTTSRARVIPFRTCQATEWVIVAE
jgi:hypothetical protein